MGKNCREGNRYVGEHKKRKCEGINYLFPCRGGNHLPFRSGSNGAYGKKRKIHIEYALSYRNKYGNKASPRSQGKRRRYGVYQNAGCGKHHRGHYCHCHIKAREISAQRAFKQIRSVFPKHLNISLCPAHTLAAGLAERSRLFIIKHRFWAKADLFAVNYVVHGELNVLGKQVKRPSAVFFKDSFAEEKACS